ncbi:MAG TPA: ABC transporter permease [Burkholderiaceae bacterium]
MTTLPRDPAWRGRITGAVLALLLAWPVLVATEFAPWVLFDGDSLRAAGMFLRDFFPPAHGAEFLQLLLISSWQTVAMATAGMTLALVAAVPLTVLITRRLSISQLGTGRMAWPARVLRTAIQWLLVLLRSVPELVWALIFVRVVGLGPTAGVLAIALTYCGMLGKVYAEILESVPAHASDTLLANGASRLGALLYGAVPEAAAELLSYTVYRWECAIRGSVVMGFVGAGGLGQRMDESLKMMSGGEVASMLLVFILLVATADQVSARLRKALA